MINDNASGKVVKMDVWFICILEDYLRKAKPHSLVFTLWLWYLFKKNHNGN